jgi:hypothetical protein
MVTLSDLNDRVWVQTTTDKGINNPNIMEKGECDKYGVEKECTQGFGGKT